MVQSKGLDRYAKLHDLLSEMHGLLVKHDSGQLEATRRALEAVESCDESEMKQELNALDFWGGSGSICDLILFDDDDRLTLLELAVIGEMQKLGIAEGLAIARREDIQRRALRKGLDARAIKVD